MPELPEVETVRRELESKILNKPIQSVEIREAMILRHSHLDLETIAYENQFSSIKRIGKLLQFFLADGKHVILAHLKMTGQFLYIEQGEVHAGIFPLLYASTPGGKKSAGNFRENQLQQIGSVSPFKVPGVRDGAQDSPFDKHTHLIFHFIDGSMLAYRDVRKFGYLTLIHQKDLDEVNAKYGPDPLHENYSLENFQQAFKNRKKSVKGVLMDQSLIAGIGNIYADEICHRTGIRPTKSSLRLRKKDKQAMYEASKDILNNAINKGGTTMRDFARSDGSAGNFAFELQVYSRQGSPCLRCSKGIIKKIVHNQRGTHYCSNCQK
ncbi:MAG: bifunctional DNA-formamidopyrimidine glycosylase/DNA-(apurinic or apyrimidinic site) lyase [Candidatus Gracilibacteria bacterium]|nr:bifunctional DNA-formamidopyrimidine glycosylase/DNA-(apurinic or apyrimidinic site) lyase [Candidatus Gracilibacteria bacterium]